MKKLFEAFSLSKSEIQLVRELAKGGSSVSKLAGKIGKSQSLTTLLWKRLEKKGIVSATRSGMAKTLQLSDTKHSILLRDLLVQHPNVPWEKLLADSHLLILRASLDRSSLLEMRGRIRVSEATLWRCLRNLMAHGLIVEEGKAYRVNPRWHVLSDFLREFVTYILRRIVEEASAQAVILWHDHFEFLMRAPIGTRIRGVYFHPTATSKLPEYGIPLLSDSDYYFYSAGKERLRVEDVALHMLLVEEGSLRQILYSLLLMKKYRGKLDEHYLLAEAEKLELRGQVEGMLCFIDKGEAKPGVSLPSREEFSERAREYGVN